MNKAPSKPATPQDTPATPFAALPGIRQERIASQLTKNASLHRDAVRRVEVLERELAARGARVPRLVAQISAAEAATPRFRDLLVELAVSDAAVRYGDRIVAQAKETLASLEAAAVSPPSLGSQS